MIEGADFAEKVAKACFGFGTFEVDRVAGDAGGVGVVLCGRVRESFDGGSDALGGGGADDDGGSFFNECRGGGEADS